MAKVALITTRWTSEIAEYAQQLKRHNQEVIVITDKQSQISDTYEGLVLRPFTHWNSSEALKLALNIFNQPIDVWHFFADSELANKGFRAFLTLMSLNQVKNSPIITLSLTVPHANSSLLRLKWLLKFTDVVTFQTREDLMYFKRNDYIPASVQSEVWSPNQLLSLSRDTLPTDLDLDRIIATRKPFFVLPTANSFFQLNEKVKNSDWSFIVLEKAPHRLNLNDSAFTFIEGIGAAEIRKLSLESSGWILNEEELSSIELLNIQAVTALTKTPILCNPYQLELAPGLVRHKATGLVVENLTESFEDSLFELNRLRRSYESHESNSYFFTDTIMNEILRLYNQTKVKKWQQRSSASK